MDENEYFNGLLQLFAESIEKEDKFYRELIAEMYADYYC